MSIFIHHQPLRYQKNIESNSCLKVHQYRILIFYVNDIQRHMIFIFV